jgi:GT2 family glycosyltransferase
VSVIVVCWNAATVLGRCLEHLFAQEYANREIIVVDDGSNDATLAVARAASERAELTLVQSSRNRGCPSARNLGVSRARGEIVAFIDADGFAAPSWLSELVSAFGTDPAVGCLASTVFFDDNPMVLNGAGGTVNRQGWAADLSMNESLEVARIAPEALYPMGCGMAVRREALERIGPFDDRMLNYYDDVDYGVRAWRAGYSVLVAREAWIDHASAREESTRKRLLCERHRMRVVLKHAASDCLARWASWELRALTAAPRSVRLQKLRAIAWNACHLPSAIAARLRGARAGVPGGLLAPSWGDGFPVGMPSRATPSPSCAGSLLDLADQASESQLLHGWFPRERVQQRSYRWATTYAAALLRVEHPVRRLHLDYAHVPVDTGAVELRIRRVDSARPTLEPVWQTVLPWQYIARSVENHPLHLPAGDYEVIFAAERGWSDPPRETRSLALALSELALAESFEIVPGGVDMASADAEKQLVRGWYEAEQSSEHSYRWATGEAAAVVRLDAPATTVRLAYRFPPVPVGSLAIELTPLDGPDEVVFATRLTWQDPEWCEVSLSLALQPGDYLLSMRTERTWSNRDGRDPALWAENRELGFALSSVTFHSSR